MYSKSDSGSDQLRVFDLYKCWCFSKDGDVSQERCFKKTNTDSKCVNWEWTSKYVITRFRSKAECLVRQKITATLCQEKQQHRQQQQQQETFFHQAHQLCHKLVITAASQNAPAAQYLLRRHHAAVHAHERKPFSEGELLQHASSLGLWPLLSFYPVCWLSLDTWTLSCCLRRGPAFTFHSHTSAFCPEVQLICGFYIYLRTFLF